MPKKIYIYGAGGHARVVASTARLCGYEIAGFFEDTDERVGKYFCESRIVSLKDIPNQSEVFIAFGDNKNRLRKGKELSQYYKIPIIIHPSSQVAEGTKIGFGSYIGALGNIDPGCQIGNFCIINNCANISHETILESGCHICGGVNIAGRCYIGECAMVGIGSCMIENRFVGKNTIIGAGSVVIRDIKENCIAVGSPAKVISQNNK